MFFAGTVPRHPSRRFPRLSSWLFRFSLLRADAITLREEFSLQNMKRARAERGDVQVTADVAYLLKPASSERVAQIFDIEQIPQDRPLIGMTISKVRAVIAYPDSSPSQSYRKHIEMMARIVDRIVDVSGATIILLPHSIGMDGNGDDRLVAQDIRESCRQRVNVFSISGEYGPEELKGVIGRCQMFVGERLHSVIGATTLGVPAIAMSYAADTRLAMVRPMVTDDYVIPLENLDEEALIDKIRRLWQQRASVAEALNERAISMRRRARVNGEVLRRLLEQQD
jgi:polysaccharide pyruvyl transferase WcaK-like protein